MQYILDLVMNLFLPRLSGIEDIANELLRVRGASKLEFFYMFREVFFISITEKNIQGGFAGTSLIPYNPDRVISKLDIQLRTPTPTRPPDPATYWVFKTPQNPIETSSQTELIKNRITNN
jgi:hypothetical protein